MEQCSGKSMDLHQNDDQERSRVEPSASTKKRKVAFKARNEVPRSLQWFILFLIREFSSFISSTLTCFNGLWI